MPCVARVKGECPYRTVYQCTDELKVLGLSLRHCVIEHVWRDAMRRECAAGGPFEEGLHERLDQLIELYLDANLYWRRALAWESILFDRCITERRRFFEDPECLRSLLRYHFAASERLARRYLQVTELLDVAIVATAEA